MSTSTKPLPPSLHQLADLNGRVITSDDPSYDQSRAVFYGGIDKRPDGIVRVTTNEDVRRVVATARDQGCELAIRSGKMRVAQLRVLGGEMARVPADATAYAHRTKPMLINVCGVL
ncbi:MAG: hypothetical protein ABI625_05565 [bacterium]